MKSSLSYLRRRLQIIFARNPKSAYSAEQVEAAEFVLYEK